MTSTAVKGRAVLVAARASFQAGCATIDRDRSHVDEDEHDAQIDELCKRERITSVDYFEARAVLAAFAGRLK